MVTIMLKDIYNVTQISARNTKAWVLMANRAKEYADDEVVIDTDGVIIENPCANMEFKKLMNDTRIKLVLHNSSDICELIQLYCEMCGFDKGRVTNVGIIEEIVTTVKEYDDEYVEKFIGNSEIDGEAVYFDIIKSFSQVGSKKTMMSIIEAINRVVENNSGIKKIILNFENIHVQEFTLEFLHLSLKDLANKYEITVANLPNQKIFNDIKDEDEGFNNKMSGAEKIALFKDNVPLCTVGFLCKYKVTKKVDRLGRHGDGQPLWSRFSIYKGIKDGKLIFDTYRASDFYTKIHQEMELENSNPVLVPITVRIGLEEIGILNKFTGSDYHFNYPIQYKAEDSIYMRTTEMYAGQLATVYGLVRLPEIARAVLNDFNIKYNKEKLEYAINETNRILLNEAVNGGNK